MRKYQNAFAIFVVVMTISIFWPMLVLILFLFLSCFVVQGQRISSIKEGLALVGIVIATFIVIFIPHILFESGYIGYGILLLSIITIAFLCVLYIIRKNEVNEEKAIQTRREEVASLFGEEYVRYQDM